MLPLCNEMERFDKLGKIANASRNGCFYGTNLM